MNPINNECTECGWQGTDEQKVDIMQPDGMGLLTCPICGCGEFYVEALVKNCTIPDVSKCGGDKLRQQLIDFMLWLDPWDENNPQFDKFEETVEDYLKSIL